MVKSFKLKFVFLLAVAFFVSIASLNVAQAQESKNSESVGEIAPVIEGLQPVFHDFNNIEELNNYIGNEFKDFKILEIYLNKDLDFKDDTLTIYEGTTVRFNVRNHTLFSSTPASEHSNMINVKGTLNLSGTSNNARGTLVEEFSDDATIKVSGKIIANFINFTKPEKFDDDDAPSDGGLFYFYDVNQNSEFHNCFFSGKAENGGAFYINNCGKKDSTILFQDCEFRDCRATEQGGAFYNDAEFVNLKFDHTLINGCDSHEEGGAFACISSNTKYTFLSSHVEWCSSDNDGGGMYVRGNHVVITGKEDDNDRSYNTSTFNVCCVYGSNHGGAIYTSYATNRGNDVDIKYIDFRSNKVIADKRGCRGVGGALCLAGARNNVIGCNFFENTASSGGAIYTYSAAGQDVIRGCTFDSNTSDHKSGLLAYINDDLWNGISDNIIYYHYEPFTTDLEFELEKGINWEDHFKAVHV